MYDGCITAGGGVAILRLCEVVYIININRYNTSIPDHTGILFLYR